MDTDNPLIASAKTPPLNSDQLNYLIWRYLQEAGYGEAAVKLQRDWNVDAENLPFAPLIKGSALIKLVQQGLRYHHLALTIDDQGRASRKLEPSQYYFGPESGKPVQEVRDITHASSIAPRPVSPASLVPSKREAGPNGVHEGTPQPTTKRSRKPGTSERNGSTGRKPAPTSTTLVTNIELNAPNGHPASRDLRSPSATEPPGPEDIAAAINGVHGEDRMDVDTDGELQVDFTSEPPILPTLVHGESRAIQVEPAKVADLGPSTSIISTPDRMNLSQVIWHPTDRSILTGRGDTFCGVWRAHTGQFQDLVRYSSSEDKFVTAVAWEPHGRMLAVAVSSAAGGELHLYDGTELGLLETLTASQRMIMRLHWQEDGMRLVGLAPMDDNAETAVLLWDLSNPASSPMPQCVKVPETLEDVDCAMFDDQSVVCASGNQTVYRLSAETQLRFDIRWVSSQSGEPDNWSFVKCAWQGNSDWLVVAASSVSGRIWLPEKDLIHQAHQAPITSLQMRPQPSKGSLSLSTTEFATCSMDGTIKAWSYNQLRNSISTLCKLTLGHSQPLKALAYSPDGFCLSGAGSSDVRIWNAEHGYNQMAAWSASSTEWAGNTIRDRDVLSNDGMSSVNGESGAVEHSLSWDGDSMKLAFSLTSQVAIINFQR